MSCPWTRFGCIITGSARDIDSHLRECTFERLKVFLVEQYEVQMTQMGEKLARNTRELERLREFVRTSRTRPSITPDDDDEDHDYAEQSVQEGQAAQVASAPVWPISPNLQCVKTVKKRNSGITSLTFSREGSVIYAGSYDGTVTLLPLSDQLPETTDTCFSFSAHQSTIWSLSFSNRTRRLYSGGSDSKIKVWNANYLESRAYSDQQPSGSGEIKTLPSHNGKIYSLCNHDKWLLSGSSDKNIMIWNEDTFDLVQTLSGHGDNVNSLTYASNSNHIVSGSSDKSVRVWDMQTGTMINRYSSEMSEVLDVCLDTSQNTLFASRYDAVIEVWDLRQPAINRPTHSLTGHNWEIWRLAHVDSNQHQALFSGSFDRKPFMV
jgi:WD40 repeat protein